tara:strand:- start:273 stop:743 length:471 start_codon:yes stop_codon:yes gene_type:complete
MPKRQLMKLVFKRSHPKCDWRNDRKYVFVDISKRFLQEVIKEIGESLVTEDHPNIEYLSCSPALDFDYFRPLLATLPKPFDQTPKIDEYHQEIEYTFDDEEELKMEDMVTLIEFCKEHELTFEMTTDYHATDRCGFLAYDSVVTPYIKIILKDKES